MTDLDLSKITLDSKTTTLSGQVTLNINLSNEETNEPQTIEPNLDEALTIIAKEVLKGTYGNGDNRKANIYRAVQEKVNELNK